MGELITLQFGNFSNHVGSHFWNALGESILHEAASEDGRHPSSVFFRSGVTAEKYETYLPRMVMFDAKGNYGSLRKSGYIYDSSPAPGEVLATPFQQALYDDQATQPRPAELDRQAASFSDYLLANLHPRSAVELLDIIPQVDEFSKYADGYSVMRNDERADGIMDHIRFFMEESDRVQGFMCLCDVDSGWGGFAENILQNVHDDLSRAPVMLYSVSNQSHSRWRTQNVASGLTMLREYATTYAPIAVEQWAADMFPNIALNLDLDYHSSAVLASVLDTLTLPLRTADLDFNLSTLTRTLSDGSLNIVGTSAALPFPLQHDQSLVQFLDSCGPAHLAPLFRPLMPLARSVSSRLVALYSVLRGFSAPQSLTKDSWLPVKRGGVAEIWRGYTGMSKATRTLGLAIDDVMRVSVAYPRFFRLPLNNAGLIDTTIRIPEDESQRAANVRTLPMAAQMELGGTVHPWLLSVVNEFTEARYSSGMDADDYREIRDRMQAISDTFSTDDSLA
eukprot:TRINITY_DN9706_c0_g1_i1.p1 TRINITY_DN9706_c0_g1~~TRINITY_DN9706_c0_g1_i1.p1  ORF type:complete len:506 (+),score=89.45 TRINITY_DN9706_c0_g1_i1:199-1716(+)